MSFIDPLGLTETKDEFGRVITNDDPKEITVYAGPPETFLESIGNFLAGAGLGAIGFVGDAIAAPFDFLMNYREPEYQQRLSNQVTGLANVAQAVAGDQTAQAKVAASAAQAAETWWNAPAFDKGVPVGYIGASVAVPYAMNKFAAAGLVGRKGRHSVASRNSVSFRQWYWD